MTTGRSKGLKKSIALTAAAMIMTLSTSTTAFASPLFYDSEEGIGIEVENPVGGAAVRSSLIECEKVSVSGGTLWATWKDGVSFRANYDHYSKTHRCSATNDHVGEPARSEWMDKGVRAESPWLDQTISNNRVWAATRD